MPDLTPLEAAEKLEQYARSAHLFGCIPTFDKGEEVFNFAASYLRKIAAGKYKPVVHGHWIGGYAHKDNVWTYTQPKCSNCHNTVTGGTTKYCPSCSALMGGKDDSHETD
ncbi:hypothetical protein EQM14_01555 [Caproiciproducens sp. NJN-50]|uniref:hypothetical protein n=1 Tax=Caproiciproducens sp. NJN-50 TaxID=2507162 RepID=UPI000FFE2F32|nr:hypothetical protein [Caproiciproducens sp. NJN-50]QAT48570.1 hypothetical protein EQM14_01555 [Caproiciproducens sp. NJN-50]